MATSEKAPLGDGALPEQITDDAGSADAVAAPDYTTAVPHSIPPRPCPLLIIWQRCHQYHAGYFAASAPGPQPCPACMGGRLQPVAIWDLRTDAAPPGMLARPVVQEVLG